MQESEDNKDFTRRKFEWIERVARCSTAQRYSHVAIILVTTYLHRKKMIAWPSQETLAEEVGIGRATVQRALRSLARGGHIKVRKVGHGPDNHNEYEFVGISENASKVMRSNTHQPRAENASVSDGECIKSDAGVPLSPSDSSLNTTGGANAIEILFSVGGVDIEADRRSISLVQNWIDRAQECEGVSRPVEYLRLVIGQCRTKWHDPRTIKTMKFYQGAVEDALAQRIR